MARFSELPALLSYLVEAAQGMTGETLLRASLAVEELFTNSIHHGYGGESDRPVWLAVECLPAGLRIHYADAASPFDPLTGDPAGLVGDDHVTRRVGGLGRVLIRDMAQASRYRYADGRNEVTLDYLSSDNARPS